MLNVNEKKKPTRKNPIRKSIFEAVKYKLWSNKWKKLWNIASIINNNANANSTVKKIVTKNRLKINGCWMQTGQTIQMMTDYYYKLSFSHYRFIVQTVTSIMRCDMVLKLLIIDLKISTLFLLLITFSRTAWRERRRKREMSPFTSILFFIFFHSYFHRRDDLYFLLFSAARAESQQWITGATIIIIVIIFNTKCTINLVAIFMVSIFHCYISF